MSDTKHNTRRERVRPKDVPKPAEYPFGHGGVYKATDEADSEGNLKRVSVYSVPRARGKPNRRWLG